MENKQLLLEKFAKMIIKSGVNLQKGQLLVIKTNVECFEFAREISKCAYEEGASDVIVKYNDEYISKARFMNVKDEKLEEVPDYVVNEAHYIVDQGGCFVSISSPTPEVMKGVDPSKIKKANIASFKKLGFYRNYTMENKGQWCVVSYPNEAWAKKVFNNQDNAYELLLEAILEISRVKIDNDPIEDWNKHLKELEVHNKKLNEYNFKALKFKNSLGTDLTVGLVEDHIWAGGGEYSQSNIFFSPNIPTEETFTMPDRMNVNGRVYSTKPLNYQGNLIEDFYLDFKDGKVVNFKAKKNEEVLKALLTTDEGSSRLGEVALISNNSLISNKNILFYNTLFDENASCHLALGNAYTMNIKGGYTLSEEELIKKGYNKSLVHVDFMFGNSDMSIIGVKHDGEEVVVFKDGNFVF